MIDSPKTEERRKLGEQRNPDFTPASFNCPIEVDINPFLTNTEKRMFSMVHNLSMSRYGCKATNEYLSERLGTCEQTITNSLSNLQTFGYLQITVKRYGSEHSSRSIFIDSDFYKIYREAVSIFNENYRVMGMRELNEKLMLNIIALDSEIKRNNINEETAQTIKKFIVKKINNPTEQTIKKFIVKTKDNIDIKPFFDILSKSTSKDILLDDTKKGFKDSANLSYPYPLDSHLEENKPSIETNNDVKVAKKLNRRNLQVGTILIPSLKPETKPISIIPEKKPSLKESASAGMQADAEKKKEKYKVRPLQNIPEPIQEVMNFWEQLGFKLPNKDKATKGFNNTIQYLKKIQAGKLILNETRKFSIEEIKNAMIRFSMLAFDNYGLHSSESRKKYAEKTLCCFLYSPAYGDTLKKYPDYTESWFIKCHDMEEEPKKVEPVIDVVDLHPNITKRIKDHYKKHVFGEGLNFTPTPKEEASFRSAANWVCDYYDKRKHTFFGINGGYIEMADILFECVKKQYGENIMDIHPGSFASKFIHERMFAYMKQSGITQD